MTDIIAMMGEVSQALMTSATGAMTGLTVVSVIIYTRRGAVVWHVVPSMVGCNLMAMVFSAMSQTGALAGEPWFSIPAFAGQLVCVGGLCTLFLKRSIEPPVTSRGSTWQKEPQ